MPIIFALSILLFPGMLANFLGGTGDPYGLLFTKEGDVLKLGHAYRVYDLEKGYTLNIYNTFIKGGLSFTGGIPFVFIALLMYFKFKLKTMGRWGGVGHI